MFQDNLKVLRKKKGITQEELAARLNVVRQTVSKWEKGLSVPDSELLIKLAEILEVPVSRLLGSKIEAEEQPDALAEQLSRINEQFAIKNRRAKRVWKAIAFIVGGIIAVYVENAGAKTESESVKNDLATIIQELINNGALDLSSFNG